MKTFDILLTAWYFISSFRVIKQTAQGTQKGSDPASSSNIGRVDFQCLLTLQCPYIWKGFLLSELRTAMMSSMVLGDLNIFLSLRYVDGDSKKCEEK